LASRGQFEGDTKGGVGLSAEAAPWSILHFDEVGCVLDMNIGRQAPNCRNLLAKDGFVAHEENVKSSFSCLYGTLNRGSRGVISPHSIECDTHDAKQTSGSSGFLNVEDATSSVGAALHADAVPLFPLATVLTVDKGWIGIEAVVASPLIAPGLAGLSLGNSHCSLSSLPGPVRALRTRHYG